MDAAPRPPSSSGAGRGLFLLRYGLPALLVVAGFAILLLDEGSRRWDGWAMCVGAALSLIFFSVVFKMGAEGDRERDAEAEARAYLAEHGRWPDDPPGR